MSVKTRIAQLNTRLAEKLTVKGVEADGAETTTALIDKMDDIEVGGKYEELFNLITNDNTDYSYLFHNTKGMSSPPVLDTSNVERFDYMFYGVGDGTGKVDGFYVGKAIAIIYMFTASKFVEIGSFTFPSGLDVQRLFQSSSVQKIGIFRTPSCKNQSFTFSGCDALTEIEGLSGSMLSGGNNTFTNCTALTTIGGIYDDEITGAVRVQKSPLDLDTAKRIINALSTTEISTLFFSPTTLAYLEAEGATAPNGMTWLEYAESKGWAY